MRKVHYRIEFYDSEDYKYAYVAGFPVLPSNVRVYALTPPSYGSVVVEVYQGRIGGE